tara:strand:- start:2579 stop:2818 length:240 start_codon:yes stop_codon:yes gene_type:complete
MSKQLLERAAACGAPVGPLKNIKTARWKQSPMGQTFAPAKVLKNTETGQRLSIGQARQIVEKFERMESNKKLPQKEDIE